jgi:hypothetical protein
MKIKLIPLLLIGVIPSLPVTSRAEGRGDCSTSAETYATAERMRVHAEFLDKEAPDTQIVDSHRFAQSTFLLRSKKIEESSTRITFEVELELEGRDLTNTYEVKLKKNDACSKVSVRLIAQPA